MEKNRSIRVWVKLFLIVSLTRESERCFFSLKSTHFSPAPWSKNRTAKHNKTGQEQKIWLMGPIFALSEAKFSRISALFVLWLNTVCILCCCNRWFLIWSLDSKCIQVADARIQWCMPAGFTVSYISYHPSSAGADPKTGLCLHFAPSNVGILLFLLNQTSDVNT